MHYQSKLIKSVLDCRIFCLLVLWLNDLFDILQVSFWQFQHKKRAHNRSYKPQGGGDEIAIQTTVNTASLPADFVRNRQ